MNYKLTLREEAELDINDAFEYYENQRLGLGHDFLLCVEESLSKVERNPTHYRITYKNLRRISIHRFPYRIFYFLQDYQVIVTAVFHARKDPQSWSNRIK